MTHRWAALAGALALVAAACGGGGSSCADIAVEAVDLVQDVINEVDQMTQNDLEGIGETDLLDDFTASADELDERATASGCSDDEMAQLVTDEAQRLTADTQFGQLFIDSLRSGALFEG